MAPVEETIFFSSIFIPGRDVGTEPVPITIFFPLYWFFFPELSITVTVSFEVITPFPLRWVILFYPIS